MTNRSRILIADDHILVADLCRKLLETEFDVVGTVCDGRALIRSALELKPDVIVVDIAMPMLNGLDAGQQVKELLPAVKLIYLTMNPDPEVVAEAFRRGASGYLLKTCTTEELVAAGSESAAGAWPTCPRACPKRQSSTCADNRRCRWARKIGLSTGSARCCNC